MPSLQYKCGTYWGVFSDKGKSRWIKLGRGIDRQNAKKLLKEVEIARIRGKLNLTVITPLTLYQF